MRRARSVGRIMPGVNFTIASREGATGVASGVHRASFRVEKLTWAWRREGERRGYTRSIKPPTLSPSLPSTGHATSTRNARGGESWQRERVRRRGEDATEKRARGWQGRRGEAEEKARRGSPRVHTEYPVVPHRSLSANLLPSSRTPAQPSPRDSTSHRKYHGLWNYAGDFIRDTQRSRIVVRFRVGKRTRHSQSGCRI